MILFNSFKAHYNLYQTEFEDAVKRVLRSGYYIMGEETRLFEHEFSAYIGTKYCVGVASGTEAIALALMSLDIEGDDEVITTNVTAFPTITGIIQAGAKPIVVDVTTEDGLMDYSLIEEKITSRTKAILPVHLYGQCCDLDLIKAIADKHHLHLVEDVAQAAGSTYKNNKAGSIGICNAFSFYPTKNLGAFGDAGAITTDDEALYKRLLSLRNYGQTTRYFHEESGINSRLDEIQAAILSVKLKYLDEWNQKRRVIAKRYSENLKGVEPIYEHPYGKSNYHLYVVKSYERDELIDYLRNHNIQSLIHYPIPIHDQKAFKGQKNESMPKSKYFTNSILSLPNYPELTESEQDYIIQTINNRYA